MGRKKFPGHKYNKDKHIELLEIDAIGDGYRREIYQLMRKKPCPLLPRDVFRYRTTHNPSRFANQRKHCEYMRVLRDELAERVATGTCPEERLRLLWAGRTDDYPVCNPHRLFQERKIAVPLAVRSAQVKLFGMKTAPIGQMSEYGIKLSPLQEDARDLANNGWGGAGKRWVNDCLKGAQNMGAEGIIHFNLIGCTPMNSMGSVTADRAEKELHIPTLNFEGRQMDKDYMSQERFDEILSTFIDKCFDRAGKPRN